MIESRDASTFRKKTRAAPSFCDVAVKSACYVLRASAKVICGCLSITCRGTSAGVRARIGVQSAEHVSVCIAMFAQEGPLRSKEGTLLPKQKALSSIESRVRRHG